MDIRNLNRYFTINKAVSLFGRSSGYSFSFADIHVLVSLVHLDSVNGVGVVPIYKHLASFKRTMSNNQIIEVLSRLASLGLVDRVSVRYRISFSGRIAVNELERRCRETRYDK